MEIENWPRKKLQKYSKQYGIRANQKNEDLIASLKLILENGENEVDKKR